MSRLDLPATGEALPAGGGSGRQAMTMGGICSGIGGFERAATLLGMDVRWACEIEPYCQRVLKKHWPEMPVYPDLRELKGADVEPVTILCGGPPCQSVSVAGKQLGEADDRWLWPEVHRFVGELRPRWCCFENPPGLLGVGLHKATGPLESLGYEVRVASIPACAVGAPHERQRLWIIAHADSAERRSPSQGRHVPNGNDAGREEAPGRSCPCDQDATSPDSAVDGRGPRRPRRPACDCARQSQQTHGNDADPAGLLGPAIERGESNGIDGRGGRERFDFGGERGAAESGVRGVDARLSAGLDGPWGGDIPDPLKKNVPHRMARLTALGNAVVPQCAEIVLRAILDAERDLP